MRDSFLDAGGTSDTMIKKLQSSFAAATKQVEKMRGDIEEELGFGFMTVLTPALMQTSKALETFLGWLKAIPSEVKVGAAVVFLGTLAIVGLTGALMVATVSWPFFTGAVKLGWGAMIGFTRAAWMAIAPLSPWIIGIGLAAFFLYKLWTAADNVSSALKAARPPDDLRPLIAKVLSETRRMLSRARSASKSSW